jgi:hypothetical protein
MKAPIRRIEADFPVDELDHAAWDIADEIRVETYWSGQAAPPGRHFAARLLWSDAALYVRFVANQNEPLVLSAGPDRRSKTLGLWDRDVCEIFIAPDPGEPERYFEFEIAPTGEWIDLGIRQLADRRETDWEYDSGMDSAAHFDQNSSIMALRVEWKSLGLRARPGLILKGNLYRCVGAGPARGYLAWSPTLTSSPNFHVPDCFGDFELV